jgi:arylsulfatase A-like enzyme
LRGQKTTPWQGGTRVAAFATGGYIPLNLRGGNLPTTIHFADVYPTLCILIGVSPADDVELQGATRSIDGLDFWPFLLNSTTTVDRGEEKADEEQGMVELHEYLPTTEDSIIYDGRWKLITNAGLYTAYWTPAHGRGPNNTAIPSNNRTEWPCVNTTVTAGGGCLICSVSKPCLFDLKSDVSERVNLAFESPQLVRKLAQQLSTYVAYVDGKMTTQDLEPYECHDPTKWWGNFTGPCCRPKAMMNNSSMPDSTVTTAHAATTDTDPTESTDPTPSATSDEAGGRSVA